jgi:hypothetical protein
MNLDRFNIVDCRKRNLELPFDGRSTSLQEIRLWRRGAAATDGGLARYVRVEIADPPPSPSIVGRMR